MSTRRVAFTASTDTIQSGISSSMRSSVSLDPNHSRLDQIRVSNPNVNQQIRESREHVIKCINVMYLSSLCFTGVFLIGMNAGFTGIRLWTCPVLNVPYIASWISLATGILMALLSLLSMFIMCIGVARGVFKPFVIILSLTWIGLLLSLVLSASFQSQILSPNFSESVTNLFIEAKSSFLTNSVELTNSHGGGPLPCFDHIQRTLGCCGVHLYSDWWLITGGTGFNSGDNNVTPVINDYDYNSTTTFREFMNVTSEYLTTAAINPVNPSSPRPAKINTAPYDIPHSCFCKYDLLENINGEKNCVSVFIKSLNDSMMINYRGCLKPVQVTVNQHLTVILIAGSIILFLHIIFFLLAAYCSIRVNRRCAVDVYGFSQTAVPSSSNIILRRVRNYMTT